MDKRAAKKLLMEAYPLMKCANSFEFQHRLQWLSEGMLKNHMEQVVNYSFNTEEIELYRAYKRNIGELK
jgi:hypothetical protein